MFLCNPGHFVFFLCASISVIHKRGVTILTLTLLSTTAKWKSSICYYLQSLYYIPGSLFKLTGFNLSRGSPWGQPLLSQFSWMSRWMWERWSNQPQVPPASRASWDVHPTVSDAGAVCSSHLWQLCVQETSMESQAMTLGSTTHLSLRWIPLWPPLLQGPLRTGFQIHPDPPVPHGSRAWLWSRHFA